MKPGEGPVTHRAIWTYGYVFFPPIACERVGLLQALLEDEHAKARLAYRTWSARVINGDEITHILVVSDSPEQDLEVNQLLEAELARLEAPFAITAAVSIRSQSGPGSPPDPTGEP